MTERKAVTDEIIAMAIFGTIGLFVKMIPFSSGFIALGRGIIGSAALLATLWLSRKGLDRDGIKNNLLLLLVSGGFIGLNWALLFESYNYTTVAVSTLCYYMSPVIVILLSPVVLKEKMTWFSGICTLVAVIGMVMISGADFGRDGFSPLGIIYGLSAAALYASVVLMNSRMKEIKPMTKTVVQLMAAAAVMAVYCLVRGEYGTVTADLRGWAFLAIVGIVHTSLTYFLYFRALGNIRASSAAIISYIDPVVATLLSCFVLKEDMTVLTVIGAVLILGSSLIHSLKGAENNA